MSDVEESRPSQVQTGNQCASILVNESSGSIRWQIKNI